MLFEESRGGLWLPTTEKKLDQEVQSYAKRLKQVLEAHSLGTRPKDSNIGLASTHKAYLQAISWQEDEAHLQDFFHLKIMEHHRKASKI